MAVWPLSLVKRLVLGQKLTPAQEDNNKTLIEDCVNELHTNFSVALNPDGTLKNNTVSTASIIDRSVTQAKLAFLSGFYAVDSGAAGAMVITWTPALTAYAAGLIFKVKAAAGNLGATTLNVDALGVKPVKKYIASGISDLASGDIVAGGVYLLVYDGTNFILLNPTPPTVASGIYFVTPQIIRSYAADSVGFDTNDITAWVPLTTRFAIVHFYGLGSQFAAALADRWKVQVRSDALGQVYDTIFFTAGSAAGSALEYDASAQFFVPVIVSAGTVKFDSKLNHYSVSNPNTVSAILTLHGYSI